MPDLIAKLDQVSLEYSVAAYPPYLKDYLIRGWRRSTQTVRAIQNLSLEIRSGERWGIVGLNGSGKSSLCGLLSGEVRPTQGKVSLHFESLRFLSEQFFYSGELTGLENLRFLLETFETQPPVEEAMERAMEFSGLGVHLLKPLKFYSKGMKARLFLSGALLESPDFILLDEVFSGADGDFQDRYFRHLETTLNRCRGVVMVTHQLDLLKTFCNRVLVMDQGRVAFTGPVTEGLDFFHELRCASPEVIHQGWKKAVPAARPQVPGDAESTTLP